MAAKQQAGARTLTGDEAFRQALMVTLAMPAGITLFAAIVLFLVRPVTWSAGTIVPSSLGPVTEVWLGVAAAAIVGAWISWRSKVVPALERTGRRPDGREHVADLQAGVILPALLFELAGFAGVLAYLVLGARPICALAAVVLSWAGTLAFRPRRAWFVDDRGASPASGLSAQVFENPDSTK